MIDPGGYIKALGYAGLLFSGLGALTFAMIQASAEFPDETGCDDPCGDWPAIPNELKCSSHVGGVSDE